MHYVIEGTIQRAGRDLRATAHLVDATNDAELWSEKYAGTLDDVFDIQERVSVGVSRRPQASRSGADRSPRPPDRSPNPQAYDLYLRARGEIWSFTADWSAPRASSASIRRLALVGPNALLLATRAAALWQIVNTGAGALSNLAEAALTARRALELDAGVRAGQCACSRSSPRCEASPRRRISSSAVRSRRRPLIPRRSRARASSTRSSATATARSRSAVARPSSIRSTRLHWSALGFALASIGRDDDAADAVYRAFEVDPSDLPTQVIAPLILYGRGDPRAVMDRLPAAAPPDRATAGGYAGLAFLTRLALVGDRARVLALLTPDVQAFLASGIHNALYAAEVFSLVGERQSRALVSAEVGRPRAWAVIRLLAKHSRSLAPLRSEPGFRPDSRPGRGILAQPAQRLPSIWRAPSLSPRSVVVIILRRVRVIRPL